MAKKDKRFARERSRFIRSQNPKQTDLRRKRRAQKIRTEYWKYKKKTSGRRETTPKKRKKEKKKEKEPEIEIIDEDEDLGELDELYSYDEEIDE